MTSKKNSLNEEQSSAVTHPQGSPACIIAGAGSGKTKVLTSRIVWLIAEGVNPRRILAITFTNKAAGELRERVAKELGVEQDEKTGPRIGTIHSFALNAIRKDAKGFGLDHRVSPLDDYGQKEMIDRIIFRGKFTDTGKPDGALLKPWDVKDKIQYHRARGLGFYTDYTPEVHKEVLKRHSGLHALSEGELEIWRLYQDEKQMNSVVDFDDMLHLVVERAGRDEVWRARLQSQFDHILMDETQDTNVVQWQFFDFLFRPDNFNAYIVGDMSQSIYAFNGAAPGLLLEYSKGWRGVVPTPYTLAWNYRSCPEIVKLANIIQKKMTETIPLHMKSFRGEQGETGMVRSLRATTPREIAHTAVHEIKQGNARIKNKVAFRDHAFLVRSASQVRDIESELVIQRIPYVIRGGRGLLQTEEARGILAYLRFAVNVRDCESFAKAIAAPRRGVGDVAIEKIRAVAKKEFDGDILRGSEKVSHAKLSAFNDGIRGIQRQSGPVDAFNYAIHMSGYLNFIKDKYGKKEPDKVEAKIENLGRLRDMIAGIVEFKPETTLEDLVFQFTLHEKEERKNEGEDDDGAVVISTIHSAKGLEWRHVYVWNCYEGSLPHMYCKTDAEIEEERRLFYVAVTRARDNVALCLPGLVQRGPNFQSVMPSRFLTELGLA
jgi:DNA helicase-2/ATP-dependent DNA helicase PcrA